MEINKINTLNNYKTYQKAGFKPINNIDILKSYAPLKTKKSKNNVVLSLIAGAAFLGIVSAIIYKRNDYIGQIKRGLELETGQKINKAALSCVVNKKQLLEMLSELSEQNYVASVENIENGTFRADLHSHTLFSDGWGKVEDIMNEVGNYADKLYAKTGKKFLFSITDHDEIKGVKEALKIIAKDPERFKNLAFVPGVELSYIQHIENDKFEGAEILAHCINPYSKKLNSFLDNLHFSRENMIYDLIAAANEKIGANSFSQEEMWQYYLKKPNENFAYNLHYRVLNYLQVKNLINEIASKEKQDGNQLYRMCMNQWNVNKNSKSADNFIEFLKKRGIEVEKSKNNDLIYEICKKMFPTLKNNRVKSPIENNLEALYKLFSKDKNAILGFAHPAFTFKSFKNKEGAIADTILKLKKLIKTTEKYHQAYNNSIKNRAITQENVNEINGIIDKYNLINIGGRDNHSPHFFGKSREF